MHKIVLANGVFDLIHTAHLRHLREARSLGSLLVVGVTNDKGVGKGPGRPIIGEDERLEMIRGLACVYQAELCKDSLEALERWRPNVFCKGSDRSTGLLPEETAFCEANGIEIHFTQPNPQTTTKIVERIRCASQ